MPFFCTNSFTTAGPSESIDTPTTVNPSFPYFLTRSMYPGISILHGPHQVAQKSTTTTLPLNCSELTTLPFTSSNSHDGAGPIFGSIMGAAATFGFGGASGFFGEHDARPEMSRAAMATRAREEVFMRKGFGT